jgi:uncharacterized protein (TIGR02246 family)
MDLSTPLATVESLVAAFLRGDLEAALSLYEPEALLVVRPNRIARGRSELRAALAEMLAVRPRITTEATELFVVGDLALYHAVWKLTASLPDGSQLEDRGRSSDILRRGADGAWRIALDNPLGTAVLAAESP